MVDSKHAMRHLNEVKPRFVVNEAVEQVAYADRIILNKVIFLFLFWLQQGDFLAERFCAPIVSKSLLRLRN